jgi:membrane-anchored protein YejM (alkaline phosphatase superfamily)
MAVLTLNILLIYAVLLLNMKGVDFTALTWFYFSTVVLGYYVFPLLIIITIISLLFLFFRKLAIYAVGAITTIYLYILLIDSLAYNVTKIHIDSFWIEWIINDPQAFGLSPGTIHAALLVLVVLVAAQVGIFVIARRVRVPKWFVVSLAVQMILALGVSQTIHAVAYEKNIVSITSMTPHLPVYYPITSHRNVVKYGEVFPIPANSHMTSREGGQSGFEYPLSELQFSEPADSARVNILILYFESWRFDMLNDGVTPNAFALSLKSTVCGKHLCSGNSTVAGVFGFFYGLSPTYWTAVKNNNAAIGNPVLFDILKSRGYTFGIFAKSNFKRHKLADAVFRGIEIQESFNGTNKVEQDKDMTRQLMAFLSQRDDDALPFLALAFYKSNHAPYVYPDEHSVFLPAEDQNLIFANDETDPTLYLNDYRNATHYVDELVGEVLEHVDTLGLRSNTIIILTTDHAEEFNDNRTNYWGHGTNFTQWQTRVPMVIYAPGKKPRQIRQATSHVDIAPTLLEEFLGCTSDVRDYSTGVNLFADSLASRPFVIGSYTNHAFVIDDNVYEIYPFYTKSYKLYDITKEASSPSRQMLSMIAEKISRFYSVTDRSSQQIAASSEGGEDGRQ